MFPPVEATSGAGYVDIDLAGPPGTQEVACQVSVKETAWPGQTLANGVLYLHWTDDSQTTIATRQTEGFPQNCKLTEDGGAQFTITFQSR
ncbi:hypothetical protein GXW82_34575 [Streptacidiphilus sp. 4-A2]|nr:hypothetical protein [Streptacidiphilus sp. 4-A2]